MSDDSPDGVRLDDIDRRILYALMQDARHTSAAEIAEEVSVSGATVRNRIDRLEESGIIEGYHPTVNFEQADDSLLNLFLCHVQFDEIERIAAQLGTIPSVVAVRELMGGQTNLHVLVVGEDTGDLRRIGQEISKSGVEIKDEFLVQRQMRFPYTEFGPSEDAPSEALTDSISLRGRAEVAELTVHENAPTTGRTLADATSDGIIREDTLVVAIERDETMITPKGETEIRPHDIVTVLLPEGDEDLALNAFRQPDSTQEPTRH
ncbi:MAG: DNA-binding Lrp family transcriptional regulator [Natronomonas sp.]|jgi:DNA-binding Lrp family transcriptional regulator